MCEYDAVACTTFVASETEVRRAENGMRACVLVGSRRKKKKKWGKKKHGSFPLASSPRSLHPQPRPPTMTLSLLRFFDYESTIFRQTNERTNERYFFLSLCFSPDNVRLCSPPEGETEIGSDFSTILRANPCRERKRMTNGRTNESEFSVRRVRNGCVTESRSSADGIGGATTATTNICLSLFFFLSRSRLRVVR